MEKFLKIFMILVIVAVLFVLVAGSDDGGQVLARITGWLFGS